MGYARTRKGKQTETDTQETAKLTRKTEQKDTNGNVQSVNHVQVKPAKQIPSGI
jgi:hypothetical protein